MEFSTQYSNSIITDILVDRLHEFHSFKDKCFRSIRTENLKQELNNKFEYILGDTVPMKLLASNFVIRFELMKLLMPEMIVLYEQAFDDIKVKGPTQFHHVTIIDDLWRAGDRETFVSLPMIQNRIRSVLSGVFDGYIGMVEFQAFANVLYRPGNRQISGHIHLISWSNEPISETLACNLNKRFWVSDFSCGDFKALEAVKIQEIGNSPEDIARVVSYMLKAPSKCKTLYRNKEGTKINLHESEASDRFVLYMRMAEILSYLSIDRLLFSSGEGVAIRRKVLSDLHSWMKSKWNVRSYENSGLNIEAFWQDFRLRSKTTRFEKPHIQVVKPRY